MLPLTYRERYQAFLERLNPLERTLTEEVDLATLKPIFSQLQQQFQGEIMTLTGEDLPKETLSRWQSSQTEIHRTMRLLQNDMMFLEMSRSSNTSQKRLATVRDRVGQLINFATVLIQNDE